MISNQLPKKRGMTGIIPVRNCIELDYCPTLGVESMLPICDEILISDGGSTDGTREFFVEWATREPKIKVLDFPWENPVSSNFFLYRWINWTQQRASYDMIASLDADEAFDPASYPRMREAVEKRECLNFIRLNLWRDPFHTCPKGTVCSWLVARLGPSEMPMVSDNIYPPGEEPEIRQNAKNDDSLRIWHLGFLREKEKFFKKCRAELYFLHGIVQDPRLIQAETTGEDWVALCTWKDQPLVEHGFALPELIKPWLKERGRL